MRLWPQSAAPTGTKGAEEYGPIWRATQGGARLRRCLPWAGMFRAFSAQKPPGRRRSQESPASVKQIVPGVFPTGVVPCRFRLAAVEWASRPLRQDGSLNRPRHPGRPYPTRLPRRTSRAHSGWKPLLLWARYDSAAAKVGGNQGRMVGRRLAVGFLQIVPGVFPTGVVTDRLPCRRLKMSLGIPNVQNVLILPPARLPAGVRAFFHSLVETSGDADSI